MAKKAKANGEAPAPLLPPACVICGREADWNRAKSKWGPAYFCDTHTPQWRLREYEALTEVARARLAALDADEMPHPRKGGKRDAV